MKKLLLIVIMCTIFISTQVNAAAVSFSKTISPNSSYTDYSFSGMAYKYGLVNVTSLTANDKYKIVFISRNTSIKEIGSSINLTSTGKKYILPRSGMSCPGGYCFGVSAFGQTKITSTNDCNGLYCSNYGIRIYNTGTSSLTIKGTYELFVS